MSIFLKQKKTQFWGFDISDLSLKLVGIRKSGNNFTITNYNSVEIPPGIIEKGKIKNEEKLIDITNRLISTAKGPKLTSRFIHACLPEPYTYIKLVKVPTTKDDEIGGAAEWAAEHNFPYTLDEIYLDWQIIEKDGDAGKTTVMLGAVPKTIVEMYSSFIKNAGLVPMSLEIEAIPIVRAILPTDKEKTEGYGIIDLGATRSSLIICTHKAIASTFSLPIAGKDITNSIKEKLSLTTEQAEQAKIICGINDKKCQGVLREVLEKELGSLIRKIKTAISFYQNNTDDPIEIKKIILTGGGAQMPGINDYLSSALKLPVTTANPLLKLNPQSKLSLPKEKIQSFTTAIGLALKPYL